VASALLIFKSPIWFAHVALNQLGDAAGPCNGRATSLFADDPLVTTDENG
jgi:hypothetical protein